VYLLPVKDSREFEITFQFPSINDLYLQKPERYLAHLLGHEGPGSVLSVLKKLGYGLSLSAGCTFQAAGFSFFKVSIELTQLGLEKIDDIVTLVFQYIALLKREGAKEWIYAECKKLADINFRFREKKRASSYTSSTVAQMNLHPGRYIFAGSLFFQYDAALIEKFIGLLTPENMRIFVVSQELVARDGMELEKEPWYGTQYRVESLPADFTKLLVSPPENPALALHPPNEFIPENLALLPTDPADVSPPLPLPFSTATILTRHPLAHTTEGPLSFADQGL